MACHRIVESGDASAVSHRETGPTREPWHFEQYTIGRGRELTVFWGTTGARGRRLACGRDVMEALILMGGWCGAHTADTTRKKTGMRLRPQVGGGVCQAERHGKKLSKVV